MFQSARIKLTLWYLLMIMLVSVLFSIIISAGINQEYNRIERTQRMRQELMQQGNMPFLGIQPRMSPVLDDLRIQEARSRLLAILVLINLGILGISAILGYFLAGRTLRPIKEMVDEQNRFITDASHELRTPLTSLKSEIEVSLRDRDLNLKDTKRLLQSNLEEVNNLQVLSDSLIRLTQNQKFNAVFEFSDINVRTILDEAIKKVIKLAKVKDIKIEDKTKGNFLEGNKQSLVEVFVIILENAIKYSPKNTQVTITSKKTDGSIEIVIKDQGIGISKEDLPHLFDRFYRVDKSRTKVDVAGYGLGLSIAKQAIKRHGGSIKVESEIGKGSTFLVEIPVKQ